MLISTLDNQFPVGWHYHSIVEWIFSVNITQGFRSSLLQHVFLRLDYKINKKTAFRITVRHLISDFSPIGRTLPDTWIIKYGNLENQWMIGFSLVA